MFDSELLCDQCYLLILRQPVHVIATSTGFLVLLPEDVIEHSHVIADDIALSVCLQIYDHFR